MASSPRGQHSCPQTVLLHKGQKEINREASPPWSHWTEPDEGHLLSLLPVLRTVGLKYASECADEGCCSSWGENDSRVHFFLAHSTDRTPVTLHLDGIVQVLNCHLSDTAIGMMTRIAVLKWLYHLYIKTPRKVSLNPGPQKASGHLKVFLGFSGPAHTQCWGYGHLEKA